jgi:hypothetical protein
MEVPMERIDFRSLLILLPPPPSNLPSIPFPSMSTLHYKGEIISLLTFYTLVTAKLPLACE